SRMVWIAAAVDSSPMPASRIKTKRKERSISTTPLQVASVQGKRDRAHDGVKGDGFRAHQAFDEIAEVQREGQISEQVAQHERGLERLQMPDEPKSEQHRDGDERCDDLVLGQGGKELPDREAGESQQQETDVARQNRLRFGIAVQVQRY